MKSFHSNGKLLISGEYLVLDGALSLALPCRFGQSLNFTEDSNGTLEWISKDMNDTIWFNAYFEAKTLKVLKTKDVKCLNLHYLNSMHRKVRPLLWSLFFVQKNTSLHATINCNSSTILE